MAEVVFTATANKPNASVSARSLQNDLPTSGCRYYFDKKTPL
jgi:hypothetical protein